MRHGGRVVEFMLANRNANCMPLSPKRLSPNWFVAQPSAPRFQIRKQSSVRNKGGRGQEGEFKAGLSARDIILDNLPSLCQKLSYLVEV